MLRLRRAGPHILPLMSISRPERPKPVRRFRSGVALDAIDKRLLREMAEDARLPNYVLAQRAGIAPSTCSTRLKRLCEVGAIRGFHADLAPEAIGLPIQAMIAVRIQGSARSQIGDYATRLAGLPGVINVYFLAGSVDFLVQVAAASPDALRQFVTDHLSASREFATTETSLVFEHVRGEL